MERLLVEALRSKTEILQQQVKISEQTTSQMEHEKNAEVARLEMEILTHKEDAKNEIEEAHEKFKGFTAKLWAKITEACDGDEGL